MYSLSPIKIHGEEKEEDLILLPHLSDALTAIMKALSTWTFTKIISFEQKILLITVNPSYVLDAASTGKGHII